MSNKRFIKTATELDAMRESGRMLASCLRFIISTVEVGMTPKDVSAAVGQELKVLGGEPAFKGFEGFPDIICISTNDQVQHAIPNAVPFEVGDIVNFDFGVRYRGMITDAGTTIAIGGEPTSKRDAELLMATKLARDAGIDLVRNGCRVGDVSAAIESVLKKHNLGIVKELVGHGVGFELHEEPEIPNYGQAGTGPTFKTGMTIAIEPIATTGSGDIYVERDGWTLRTWDKSRCAQFEHTLLVLDDGYEILTEL
jgi:methionyl aminopeptidase